MIQKGSYLNVIDNSGAKKVCCIEVLCGYRRRYAELGDIILVSIKSLRKKRKKQSKVKKGSIMKALIVRTQRPYVSKNFVYFIFNSNSVIIINKQNKFVGTRIFGPILYSFKYTRFWKLISLSSGILY